MMETKRLKIKGKEVLKSDIGLFVTYIPTHAKGNASHKDAQRGHISSFNDRFIFVRFKGIAGEACRPEDLVWG